MGKAPLNKQNGLGMTEIPAEEREIVSWILAFPEVEQKRIAVEQFYSRLNAASQPRHISGNACIKLCHYLDQCRKSTSPVLLEVAFSRVVTLGLFNFYIEWNEKNQHRSMRQVLELVAVLISSNTDKSAAGTQKAEILERLLSIIAHESAQPLVKPAFKALECFLCKRTVLIGDLKSAYESRVQSKGLVHPIEIRLTSNSKQNTTWDLIVSDTFDWMSLPDTSPAAGKLLVTLFQELRKLSDFKGLSSESTTHSSLWQRWIRGNLEKHPDSLENIKNHLFPPLFKLDRLGSIEFLEALSQEKPIDSLQSQKLDSQSFLLLSAMEVGKKLGLVDDPDMLKSAVKMAAKSQKFVPLPEKAIGELLSHTSNTVRSSAFSVLVSTGSSTRPFSKSTLDLLRDNLANLHADTDAKFRNEVLSSTRHMIERLRDASASLSKEIVLSAAAAKRNVSLKSLSEVTVGRMNGTHFLRSSETRDSSLVEDLLQVQGQFTFWYLKFLRHELIPTASYQRHITALRALQIILRSQIHSSLDALFSKALVRLLLDLLMDPFEDVRIAATDILKEAPTTLFEYNLQTNEVTTNTSNSGVASNSLPLLWSFILRAEDGSKRTGRADLADGVAHSHELAYSILKTKESRMRYVEELLSNLEYKVKVAEEDLSQAVLNAPIHGQFASLRLVWETVDDPSVNWTVVQLRMISCCERIWNAVKDILCNDSPEGHLPSDIDEVDTIDTKDVLSYSFRSIHESSNLLRSMVVKIKPRSSFEPSILPFDLFHTAGNLSFTQLASLRHRGAFSTVSLTFARCCQLTQDQSISKLPGNHLLQDWYQGALKCIHEQASTTRRSAGIPALLTGILSANSLSPSFLEVMVELKKLAAEPVQLSEIDETSLPQVHAMNSLKEIFKSSILGKRAESHTADCLQLAADSLQSEIWAIRNCGLLLLRSLIDTLFGTSESKTVTEAGWDGRSIRLSYDRYPALPELLLSLLKTEVKDHGHSEAPAIGAVESVFPALDIIRRAGPPDLRRDEIFSVVSTHLSSKVWHIRDLAARTVCTLLLYDEWLSDVSVLIGSAMDTNRLHGVLMAVKYLLERRLELDFQTASEGVESIILKLETNSYFIACMQTCAEARAAFEEIINIQLRIVSIQNQQAPSNLPIESSPIAEFSEFSVKNHTFHLPISASTKTSALLRRALAIRHIHGLTTCSWLGQFEMVMEDTMNDDPDSACAALEYLQLGFKPSDMDEHCSIQLLKMLINVSNQKPSSPQVRSLVLEHLADIMDHLSATKQLKPGSELIIDFQKLTTSFPRSGTPELSNTEIRISSYVLLCEFLSASHEGTQNPTLDLGPRMATWGAMLSSSVEAENDFDTRYAAVSGLNAFYGSLENIKGPEAALLQTSLLALYDTMNDDDDEIRNLGAKIVSKVIGTDLVPLAAGPRFLLWLSDILKDNENFGFSIMKRMTGSIKESGDLAVGDPTPVQTQLTAALVNDDSLFVEEEQNLYIDEVREAVAYSKLIARSKSTGWDKAIRGLNTWAIEGLSALKKQAETEDGSLGRTSKPRVFAICMNTILASKALLSSQHARLVSPASNANRAGASQIFREHENIVEVRVVQKLEATVKSLLEIGYRNNFHPLLLEVLQDTVSLNEIQSLP